MRKKTLLSVLPGVGPSMKQLRLCSFIAVVAMLVGVLSGVGYGQSLTRSMLVAPFTRPGWGGSSPAYLTPVLRFQFAGTGSVIPLSSIPAFPASLVNDPYEAAFNSQRELFVSNRHGNRRGLGSIARFTFDAGGNYVANGSIAGNSLEAVHGLAFSPTGELFAANLFNGKISRFLFDPIGDAIPNGNISTGRSNLGLAFSTNGELFTTHSSSVVQRFLFDPLTGRAIFNGSFVIPGASRLHSLAFNNEGELFIADIGPNRVFRVLFDNAGNPVSNGSIFVPGGPITVAFSSSGELFVGRHFSGGISRFLFDGSGNAIPNGFISTPNMGGVAITALTIAVPIDIKPGSDPNSINCKNDNGIIPVAILSTSDFDGTTVKQTTVRFGKTGTEAAEGHTDKKTGEPKRHEEDVDGDGDIDLVFHFRFGNTEIGCDDTEATLSGETFNGQAIVGTDAIRTVGGRRGRVAVGGERDVPTTFAVYENYPNPFNPITTVRYDLPEAADVTITIYDLIGRKVRTLVNQTQDAGYKSVIWDATDDSGRPISAGVYLYQIRANEFTKTRKMILLQ